jgi:tetraacyldisaccharide 4'-kinase
MIFLRKILFPFSVLYGIITSIRNFFYDIGIFKSYSFGLPIIAVGNLSVGGTGKTPQIEYLIRLLSNNYRVATLSRGYKRKSKGFILADNNSTALVLGDEPFQYFQKFNNIQVAVDEDRKHGIQQLLSQVQKPEIILLDDAFQHRKVKADFYILLTTFNDLYVNDFILPAGNLRESRDGAKRANIVIVTKCPENLSFEAQNQIKSKLKMQDGQQLFFSFIRYDDFVYAENNSIEVEKVRKENKLIIAGIAKPKPFFDFLKGANDEVLAFPDHHQFSENDIEIIKNKSVNKLVITTEKDYVRLKGLIGEDQLYYLPIKSEFISKQENFDKSIKNYVGTSPRNS